MRVFACRRNQLREMVWTLVGAEAMNPPASGGTIAACPVTPNTILLTLNLGAVTVFFRHFPCIS
jgi:hypothetical protein